MPWWPKALRPGKRQGVIETPPSTHHDPAYSRFPAGLPGCAGATPEPFRSILEAIATTRWSLSMRTALVATALVLASLPVHADDLLSTGTELPGSQGAAVPSATGGVSGLPTDQIVRLVEQQGYSDVTGLGAEGDMLKASAVNKLGSPVDLLIDPSSGKVLQSLLK
jgi:hypothetical protein